MTKNKKQKKAAAAAAAKKGAAAAAKKRAAAAAAKKDHPVRDHSSDRDSSDTDANTASSSDTQMEIEFCYHNVISSESRGYKSNCHLDISEGLMQFPVREENFEQQLKYYNTVKAIHHQNVIRLEELPMEGDCPTVLYLTAVEDVLADTFAPVSTSLHELFFRPEYFYHSLTVSNFRKFTRDVTNGLVEIQKHGICHGNLSLETIFFYRRQRSVEPCFKLGGMTFRSGNKEDLMLQDWRDLALLIEAYMEDRSLEWSNKRLLVELRHLLYSLKSGAFGFDSYLTRTLSMSEKSELIQQFVLSHPAMLESEERPSYILSSVAFLEKQKMLGKIKLSDVMFEGQELSIDRRILQRLIQVGGIPKDIEDIDDDVKGLYYVKLVRNQSGHQPQNADPILARVMGRTSMDVDQYFRREQPNVVLALYKTLKGTTFKFSGFLSL